MIGTELDKIFNRLLFCSAGGLPEIVKTTESGEKLHENAGCIKKNLFSKRDGSDPDFFGDVSYYRFVEPCLSFRNQFS